MNIIFKNYNPEPLFNADYIKIRNFLIRINSEKLYTPNFLWGAWEWEVTHGGLDRNNLDKFGYWENDGEIVAIAIYEMPLGDGLLIVDEEHRYLIPDVITYAKKYLHDNGKLRILIANGDYEFSKVAIEHDFRPTQNRWNSASLDINKLQSYSLPEGFSFMSMADDWNWQQYNRVMWRGFNNEGKAEHDEKTISGRKEMLSSPMINPELVIVVVAPDGNYVSHCGMWYRPGDFYCYVEPVVTDPEYRKMGLGKAVVLEGIRRCGNLGAMQAVVGSDQQFYYNIGFYPIYTGTWWEWKTINCN
ncbi:MAG: GNAT family N-acetyltransferase [Lachnospiraceae bacterium]|jgi:GNAT superfamily N-acetyltransferase|nr:GNAT family N-acetyltransferase [Lachnospiraceae bacterium]